MVGATFLNLVEERQRLMAFAAAILKRRESLRARHEVLIASARTLLQLSDRSLEMLALNSSCEFHRPPQNEAAPEHKSLSMSNPVATCLDRTRDAMVIRIPKRTPSHPFWPPIDVNGVIEASRIRIAQSKRLLGDTVPRKPLRAVAGGGHRQKVDEDRRRPPGRATLIGALAQPFS